MRYENYKSCENLTASCVSSVELLEHIVRIIRHNTGQKLRLRFGFVGIHHFAVPYTKWCSQRLLAAISLEKMFLLF